MPPRLAGRLALLAFLAIYGFVALRTPDEFRLLDSVDLAIHETGHLVFAPFGEWMGMAGGTIFQLLVPIAFVVSFVRRGDWFAGSVCLWWVGQNCWNIARYIRDARAQELPLVGGGEHDWAYLLGEAGRLSSDIEIARMVHAVGALVYACSIGFGLIVAARVPPEPAPAEEIAAV